jgi:protein-S-isoprenylcysteine O-methyltransferase Ste14
MPLKDLILVSTQLVLFILFALAGSGYANHFWLSFAAFILTLSGIIICATALIQLGENLTPVPTPRKSGKLVETGIYKFIRHPIYTGLVLIVTGIAIYNLSYQRLIITGIIFFFFLYKLKYEESLLKEKYPDYANYIKRTGRMFPKLWK